MQPFWNYYGGKFRAAPRYPKPLFRTIIEPFAGAAGYSLRYADRNVFLIERYPVLAEMWRYLIAVSPDEVRRIPEVEHVDDLPAWVPAGARALVGFTLTTAAASPRKSLTSGLRKLRTMGRRYGGWYAERRERVASQVERIRHWRIIEGDYTMSPNVEATWFIDPPYQHAGSHYVCRLLPDEYDELAAWCRSRRGQVMVCENVGATWLPFAPFLGSKSGPRTGYSQEALWCARTRITETEERSVPSCERCWGQGKLLREQWCIPVGLDDCDRCGGSGWESNEAVELRRLQREHAEEAKRKAQRDESERLAARDCRDEDQLSKEAFRMPIDEHHLAPLNDAHPHVLDGKPCWCGAKADTEVNGLIVHNAADNRDLLERVQTTHSGERVWLRQIAGGVTECCPADAPCGQHGRQ